MLWASSMLAQDTTDPEFYLLEGFELSPADDKAYLDSVLTLYHQETADTNRIIIATSLVNSHLDIKHVMDYNDWIAKQIETRLQQAFDTPEEEYFFKYEWGQCLVRRASINQKMGNFDEILPNLIPALEHFNKMEAWERSVLILVNMSSVYLFQGNNDKAKECMFKSLALGEKMQDTFRLAKSNILLGHLSGRFGELDSALFYYGVSIELYRSLNDSAGMSLNLSHVASVYRRKGDLDTELKYLFEAMRLGENQEDKMFQGITLMGIGNVYHLKGEEEEAEDYLMQALDLGTREGDKIMTSNALIRLGFYYYDIEQYAKAMEMFEREMVLATEIKHKEGVVKCHRGMGMVYMEQDSLALALEQLQQSVLMADELRDPTNACLSLYELGRCYFLLGQLDEARQHLERSLEVGLRLKDPKALSPTANILTTIYKQDGNWEKAVEMLELSHEMDSTVNSQKNQRALYKREYEYEAQKKEQELQLAEEQSKVQALELDQKNNTIVGLVVGLLLVIVIIALLLLRHKARIKQREAEFAQRQAQLKQQALQAQMNPHFLFNALNSIQMIYVQGDVTRANDYLSDFAHLLRSILDSSGKERIAIAEEVSLLELYLRLEQVRTEGQVDYTITTDATIDASLDHIPPMVIQPFVENAIWHGILPSKQKGVVAITLSKPGVDILQCVVSDNGVGIEQSKKQKKGHVSKGIALTKERLGAAGNVLLESLKEGGTRVTINIPLS